MQQPRVALYARYSTDMQNPKSVEDQFRECRVYAERQGWQIVECFADHAISGAIFDRPGYQALLSSVRTRQFDIVLFEHVDRLGRDIEFAMGFHKAATHADTEIHQIGGKLELMNMSIYATFSELQLLEIGKKTRQGLVGKVLSGRSAGGLSYGYRVAKDANGQNIKGNLEIVEDQAAIVRRIFREYVEGKSPQKIAERLNQDGIPSPRGRGAGSGHWKQNTINGNRERANGILNNELYIGRYLWGRLRYSKLPETGKRVSRPVPRESWHISDMPDLQFIDQELWLAAKDRQESLTRQRSKRKPTDANGLSASQSLRRRKYLLSGLLQCGQCGGNLTVAGSGKARRYYCANAKEKAASVCKGMPGLKEELAAETILSSLRQHLMRDEAFQEFKVRYLHHLQHQEKDSGEALRLHDQRTRELDKKLSNLMEAVENGQHSDAIIERLNSYDQELKTLRQTRDRLVPTPIRLSDDMPSLYRGYIDDLER